jgi:hypothetical protein
MFYEGTLQVREWAGLLYRRASTEHDLRGYVTLGSVVCVFLGHRDALCIYAARTPQNGVFLCLWA